MIELSEEQKRAYQKFISMRDKVGLGTYGRKQKNKLVPHSEVVCSVDIAGFNHPFFERNDLWLEYIKAFEDWLRLEPDFRKQERMSMIRGDYGDADSWRDKQPKVKEIE